MNNPATAVAAPQAGPLPMDEPLTMGPPQNHCAVEEPMAPPPPPPHASEGASLAPLKVQVTAKGITVDAEGATAGRVLTEIAAATKHGIEVHDAGAGVPIYAHIRDQSWDALVRSVAQAAGLDVVEPPDDKSGKLTVLDGWTKRERDRRVRAAQISLTPVETRLIATKHAEAMAHVVAMTLLSCRGLVTAAPQRSVMVVRDYSSILDRIQDLAHALDASPAQNVKFDVDAIRSVEIAPAAHAPLCTRTRQDAAPNLPAGPALSAQGNAAGDLLQRAAVLQDKDVVIGCGGDAPAYYAANGGAATLADMAAAVGLVPLGGNVYGSSDLLTARAAESLKPPTKHQLRSFVVADARELSAVTAEMIAHSSAAVAYEPESMLIILGSEAEMASVETLVKAWSGH